MDLSRDDVPMKDEDSDSSGMIHEEDEVRAKPWISGEDYNRYSLIGSLKERVPEGLYPEASAGSLPMPKKKKEHIFSCNKKTGTDKPKSFIVKEPVRKAAKREPHSSSRMGGDKLQVRASADTPYDLDTAAAMSAAAKGSSRGSSKASASVDDFAAKLARFRKM